MAPDRSCCAARRRRARLGWALASWIALAALPKCPLCIVAYLSAIGIGAGIAAPLASIALPVARLAAVMSVAMIALSVARGVRRAHRVAVSRAIEARDTGSVDVDDRERDIGGS
jgi:hypothetical protein